LRAAASVAKKVSDDRGLILEYFFYRRASLYRLVSLFIGAERAYIRAKIFYLSTEIIDRDH